MCGFQAGDQIVCVDDGTKPGFRSSGEGLIKGATYTVREVFDGGDLQRAAAGVPVVRLAEIGFEWGRGEGAYLAERFRKVERKNDSLSIEAFLTIKPGFEEPKRTPAKKRERV